MNCAPVKYYSADSHSDQIVKLFQLLYPKWSHARMPKARRS
eukprot:SAG31_NODE_27321_length_428_cov_0.498480_2_plen_40_part_01